MNIEELILKIQEQKNDSDIDEIKVDLNRICMQGFGSDNLDMGYIEYLYKHYNNEIQVINRIQSNVGNNIVNPQISRIINMRNYLIKIAIIKTCNKKSIQYEIQRMDDINYCMGLLN